MKSKHITCLAGAGRASAMTAVAAVGMTFLAPGPGRVVAADAKPSPPAAAAAAESKPAKGSEAKAGEYPMVGFDKLAAFKYEVPDEGKKAADPKKTDEQIPDAVKAYNGKRVSLKGFMLPLKVEGGLVTELLVMRDQSMCCFGAVPKINEWVSVKMTNKGIKPVMDQAVTLYGTLKVGGIYENDYLVGIYALDGEKMDGPAF